MITAPNCYKRGCIHYLGILQPDGTERLELYVCSAFPQGIPDTISLGDDKHKTPLPEQGNSIVFEKRPNRAL